ncbi:MAG: hypothetical protein IPJ75_11395 [Ignavibacteriales bacterium]|nr:hypothetical protein [Ignavibacteriales bacterium]
MIKKFTISLILVVMTLNYLRIVGPFFDYALNYDYIVSELCVEKDEPVNDCCGSCVVSDNLTTIIEDEQEDASIPGSSQQKSIKELMPHFLLTRQIPVLNFGSKIPNHFATVENPVKRGHKPDTPPPRI